jgi:hypothetical protein
MAVSAHMNEQEQISFISHLILNEIEHEETSLARRLSRSEIARRAYNLAQAHLSQINNDADDIDFSITAHEDIFAFDRVHCEYSDRV